MTKVKICHSANSMSVQDIGRQGYQSWGISESGVIDQMAYYHNHALLQPHHHTPAIIEICHDGGCFETLDNPVSFALTGAEFECHIDGKTISWGQNHILYPQQKLKIGKNISGKINGKNNGQYGYIGFGGGILCDDILGSKSTHIANGFGGINGEFLHINDILNISDDYALFEKRQITDNQQQSPNIIRVIKHMQSDYFNQKQIDDLENIDFNLSPRFNRMSAVLTPQKPIFQQLPSLSILSEATICGDLQITGDGNIHLLLRERQPTGGYARIGTVISADIALCAQMDFRHNFRFQFVTIEQAQKIYQQYMTRITNIANEIDVVKDNKNQEILLSHNLISGIANIYEG